RGPDLAWFAIQPRCLKQAHPPDAITGRTQHVDFAASRLGPIARSWLRAHRRRPVATGPL
ncbi:hypothetical protein, partial [Frankia sp. Cr1]|uniref:hypothetical protein n=1 Tax=Frankia sp. Cr1 TaxID=3073931 RepID=UPI002AD22E7F